MASKMFARCRKILCVARNYVAHAHELGNDAPSKFAASGGGPWFFLKPPSSIIEQGSAIVLPPGVDDVHHEGTGPSLPPSTG